VDGKSCETVPVLYCVQEKLVNSMTQEDFEPASCPEEEVSHYYGGNIREG
jgi:hypothetical protein